MHNLIETVNEIYQTINPKQIDAYKVGPLLYSPATNGQIFKKLLAQNWGSKFSLALCLEDAIDDDAVELGEKTIAETFRELYEHIEKFTYIPQIFIRVRNPEQIPRLYQALGRSIILLRGFVIPKFTPENGPAYIAEIKKINQVSGHTLYMMPILESKELIPLTTRQQMLEEIYHLLMDCKEYVLNIRVGGNDLCNTFGVRRNSNETIYDIRPVSNVLIDIVTWFFNDFIISAPVWEYFADENNCWKTGLENELRLDMINGFTGKTIIHPNQIPVVEDALKVNRSDLADAIQILAPHHNELLVSKSAAGTRMNEVKTHTNWAKKQIILGKLYGVK